MIRGRGWGITQSERDPNKIKMLGLYVKRFSQKNLVDFLIGFEFQICSNCLDFDKHLWLYVVMTFVFALKGSV